MTEQQWFESNDFVMLVRGLVSEFDPSARKMYLLGCANARNTLHLMIDSRSRHIIDTVERYADNLCTLYDLDSAICDAVEAINTMVPAVRHWINYLAVTNAFLDAPIWATSIIPEFGHIHDIRKQRSFLHDIFGNPFQPIEIDKKWINNNVLGLAQNRNDYRILKHLRESHIHVNGCWVYDLILGKQ